MIYYQIHVPGRLFHRFDEIVKKFYKNMYNWIIQKVGALL